MEGKHACDRCKATSGRRIVSLIPGFINFDECGPLPRQFVGCVPRTACATAVVTMVL